LSKKLPNRSSGKMKKLALIATIFITSALLSVLTPSLVFAQSWESYNDAAHKNVWGQGTNVFDATYGTVYMYGPGFTGGGSYDIYYYDGNNNLVTAATHLNVQAALGTGKLSSSYILNTDTGAAQGLWNCGVLDAGSPTPPSTWSTSGWVAYDADGFTVDQSAIPEFPTVMAAIGVAGLCFGIYWWMKRRLVYVKA